MSQVYDVLKTVAPMPWTASLDSEGDKWGLTVCASDGKNVSSRPLDRDEARFLCALHAIAPEAMHYVEEAALKGGEAAKAIVQRFERMARYDQTPEQRAASRRGTRR